MEDAGGGVYQHADRELQLRFVVEELNAGRPPHDVVESLVAQGMGRETAEELVQAVVAAGEAEQLEPKALARAVVGAVAAAIVGGVIWGVIAVLTDYELGFIASGIGVLTGFAVVFFSGGKRGTVLQVTAVLAALLGILVGKYYTFVQVGQDVIEAELGAGAAAEFSFFSLDAMQLFFESLGDLLTGFDIVWVGLAAAAAWGIPRALGLRLPRT